MKESSPTRGGARRLRAVRQLCFSRIACVEEFGFVANGARERSRWTAALRGGEQRGACVIKGNINSSGERIYHVPGQRYYDKTQIDASKGERWFCTELEAVGAGWRKSRV